MRVTENGVGWKIIERPGDLAFAMNLILVLKQNKTEVREKNFTSGIQQNVCRV